MLIYYFASLDRYDHDDITNEGGQQRPLSSFKSFLAFINSRENRSLAILGLWATTIQVSNAIGLLTDPGGDHLIGWFTLSAIFWFNPPILYFLSRLRNILSQMSPSEISSYLFTNILTIGISSLTPMITSPLTASNTQPMQTAPKALGDNALEYPSLNSPSASSS